MVFSIYVKYTLLYVFIIVMCKRRLNIIDQKRIPGHNCIPIHWWKLFWFHWLMTNIWCKTYKQINIGDLHFLYLFLLCASFLFTLIHLVILCLRIILSDLLNFNIWFVADHGGSVKHGPISGVNIGDVSDSTSSSSRCWTNPGSYNLNTINNRTASHNTLRHIIGPLLVWTQYSGNFITLGIPLTIAYMTSVHWGHIDMGNHLCLRAPFHTYGHYEVWHFQRLLLSMYSSCIKTLQVYYSVLKTNSTQRFCFSQKLWPHDVYFINGWPIILISPIWL